MKTDVFFDVLSDLTNQALERSLADQQFFKKSYKCLTSTNFNETHQWISDIFPILADACFLVAFTSFFCPFLPPFCFPFRMTTTGWGFARIDRAAAPVAPPKLCDSWETFKFVNDGHELT